MKIIDENSSASLLAHTKKLQENNRTDKNGAQLTSTSAPQDKVVLSPKAREIQGAEKLLESLPDVRTSKVSELKRQIDGGIYQFDGQKIAMKMIKETLLDQIL